DGHGVGAGTRDGPPPGSPSPPRSARTGGDRAAALLGGANEPELDRGDDLPVIHAAIGTRGDPGGGEGPRPFRTVARSRRQRLHCPRDVPLALAVSPPRALGRSRPGACRPVLGGARARRGARRPEPGPIEASRRAPTPGACAQ